MKFSQGISTVVAVTSGLVLGVTGFAGVIAINGRVTEPTPTPTPSPTLILVSSPTPAVMITFGAPAAKALGESGLTEVSGTVKNAGSEDRTVDFVVTFIGSDTKPITSVSGTVNVKAGGVESYNLKTDALIEDWDRLEATVRDLR